MMKLPSQVVLVCAALFGVFIVAIVVLADAASLGFLYAVYDFPHGDKVAHFALYGTLSLLINLATLLATRRPGRYHRAVLATAGLALLTAIEELSPIWFPARSPDGLDLLAGLSGVFLFAAFTMLAARAARSARTRPALKSQPR